MQIHWEFFLYNFSSPFMHLEDRNTNTHIHSSLPSQVDFPNQMHMLVRKEPEESQRPEARNSIQLADRHPLVVQKLLICNGFHQKKVSIQIQRKTLNSKPPTWLVDIPISTYTLPEAKHFLRHIYLLSWKSEL